jgi:putative transposase
MDFTNGQIYHVFNRGNNSQTIFFNRENYLYFLSKINEYIKPYSSILAWCLMPNHFHLMIEVENERIAITSDPMTAQITDPMTPSHRISPPKYRTLNDSIAIMLRSYTRAVNNEQHKQGSLFQQHTKAVCLSVPEFAPAYFQSHFGTIGNTTFPEKEYPNVCFNYIHFNPVNSKLVKNPEDWEFSSYRDYFCGRNGKLVNRELAKELGLF